MKSERLFNLPLWERALDLWFIENASAAYARRDAAGMQRCIRQWLSLVEYLEHHGYKLSAYPGKVGFRII